MIASMECRMRRTGEDSSWKIFTDEVKKQNNHDGEEERICCDGRFSVGGTTCRRMMCSKLGSRGTIECKIGTLQCLGSIITEKRSKADIL